MKKGLLIFIFFIACNSRHDVVLSVYDSAFTIVFDGRLKKPIIVEPLIGEDIQYKDSFISGDSLTVVDVEVYNRPNLAELRNLLDAQVEVLRFSNGNLVLLDKRMVEQFGTEMISILYERPGNRELNAVIAERRMFHSSRGGVVVNVERSFSNKDERDACLREVKKISGSIKAY